MSSEVKVYHYIIQHDFCYKTTFSNGVTTDAFIHKIDHDSIVAAKNAELKMERMKGDHSSSCPNHPEIKGSVVTEVTNLHGVRVPVDYYRCSECEMTWLSGRQENEADRKVIAGLQLELRKARKEVEILRKQRKVLLEYAYQPDSATEFEKQYKKRTKELDAEIKREVDKIGGADEG